MLLSAKTYYGNELKYLEKVLNSEDWTATGGSWTKNLEAKFAERFDAKYAVAFNSGTSTLHAALEAVGVEAGDEVISPALSVIMNTTATLHASNINCLLNPSPYNEVVLAIKTSKFSLCE